MFVFFVLFISEFIGYVHRYQILKVMEQTKKISFSFTKSSKIPNIFTTKLEEARGVELIDCLEGQSIKLKNAVEEIKTPLIIPLRDDAKDLLDRVKQAKQNRRQKTETDDRPDSELTLDELAARELLKEIKEKEVVNNSSEVKVHSLPIAVDRSAVQNDNESTVDDYEKIPISDFGLAVLRGMGWTESTGIGKQNQQVTKTIEPELRPKGMGLGANKIVNLNKTPTPIDKDGKELTLVKGAHAKIIAGKHNGDYCEVLGLDDESGRVIIKTTIKRITLSLNEFMVVPVTKEEYIKCAKVINNATYEAYKEKIGNNTQKMESTHTNHKKADYKSSRKQRSNSSEEEKYTPKRRERSESPHTKSRSNSHKSRYRSRSPSDYKKKSSKSSYRKRSKSPEAKYTPPRRHKSSKKYDSSDEEEYNNSSNNKKENKKLKKKKSKKSKKYRESDDEYSKKKSKKSSKYSTDSSSSSSSDEEKYSRSRTKHRLSKHHR